MRGERGERRDERRESSEKCEKCEEQSTKCKELAFKNGEPAMSANDLTDDISVMKGGAYLINVKSTK